MNMQMQQNSNQETIEIFDESQSVVEPRDTDVLCGRGGMSNHHPGNEWYRRLIRSNRPLYRACPKHTKLLVSKAIVQAVDEQGGRFLERSRDNGLWLQVNYKRAVDKTSQGLREKDKDDVNDRQISLPASLRDKAKKPNIRDLAQVTLAHAGLPHTSTFKPPPGPLPNKVGSSSIPTTTNPPYSSNRNSSMTDNSAAPAVAMDTTSMPPNPPSAPGESLVLPPSLLARNTSIMRLFSQASLFGSAATTATTNPNSQSASHHPARQNSHEAAPAPMTSLGGPSLSAFFGIGSNNQSELSAPLSTTPDALLHPHSNTNNQGGEAPPPTLTRLTTQVSDWLTSFWPVGVGKDEESRKQHQRQLLQRQQQQQQRNLMQQNMMQPQQQQSIGINSNNNSNGLMAQSFGDNSNENMMNPPISLGGGGSMAAPTMNNVRMGNVTGMSRPSAAAAAASNNDSMPLPTELNHSVSATLLKLASSPSKILANFSSFFGTNGTNPVGDGNNNAMNAPVPSSDRPPQQQHAPPAPVPPGPQAVTSLGDPLVSGFSTDSVSGLAPPPPPPPGGLAKGSGILPVGRRSSKANDLLDDYEESEMEAQFRSIH